MNKRATSFLIILSFFIYSCGFTPQYAGFKNLEFDLVVDETSGDRDFNNEIKSQIKRYDLLLLTSHISPQLFHRLFLCLNQVQEMDVCLLFH